ncbi:MAG: acyl-protein synthetase [Myxococcota bacterium]
MRSRRDLEAELIDWTMESSWEVDDARFERLALELFEIQYAECAPYAALCNSKGASPGRVSRFQEIPPVPTGAFKEFPLRCFSETETIHRFRTSGTSTDRRGVLELDTLAPYEASLIASLRRLWLTDLVGRQPPMRFLAASPDEAQDSSLSHMFGALAAAEGGPGSGFDLVDGALQQGALGEAVTRAQAGNAPLCIAGTSFAFVHFLDATAGDDAARWRLPEGSRLMETGGFKGKSREVPREVLRADLASRFGLPESRVVNQYGMTELGSQFYDSTLIDESGERRKIAPPWTRVRFVAPSTGEDVEPGEAGLIVIHDLANTGSVAALQTADLGRLIPGGPPGFDVLGRSEGAEARGCSIAADVMLEASRLQAPSGSTS